MKDSPENTVHAARHETIAFFGQALLIRWPDGTYQIQGGTREDRKHAAEWAARFINVRFAHADVIAGK